MPQDTSTIGWIGIGRMGFAMAERLLKSGRAIKVWNRTRAKAEPLAALGATIVDKPSDLASVDVLFAMVSTGSDLDEVCFGANGVAPHGRGAFPKTLVDCSSIGSEESEEIRAKVMSLGGAMITAPVSGNAKCIKAGKLSAVASGPEAAFALVQPLIETFAVRGVSYVGEGELARFCKVAHNVFLGVVIQNLAEITVLAEKAGVPRHAFLDFINNSVMGSIFTRYKSPALVNLDWTTTFTPTLLRKDLDLGLAAGHAFEVPMPVTATTREALQAHIGMAERKADPAAYRAADFAALIETVALGAGHTLKSENRKVLSGLETEN